MNQVAKTILIICGTILGAFVLYCIYNYILFQMLMKEVAASKSKGRPVTQEEMAEIIKNLDKNLETTD